MNFFADRSSPPRQLHIFKFFPSSDIQSYSVYIQSFPIHPAIAWCLIPGEGFKYKWSAGTFLHWRLEDISKKRHSRVCSCWPSSTCMQFVLFLFIYKANTTSSAIWMWGPDSDKMTGTVVLRNGCRSTLWWTVFGRQEWWHLCFRRRKYWRWVIWSNRKVIAACDISAVQFEPTGNEWIALTAAKPLPNFATWQLIAMLRGHAIWHSMCRGSRVLKHVQIPRAPADCSKCCLCCFWKPMRIEGAAKKSHISWILSDSHRRLAKDPFKFVVADTAAAAPSQRNSMFNVLAVLQSLFGPVRQTLSLGIEEDFSLREWTSMSRPKFDWTKTKKKTSEDSAVLLSLCFF